MKALGRKQLVIITTVMLFVVAIGAQQLFGASTPWIGIYMQDVTTDLAEAFGLSAKQGVVINDVTGDSPAEKAGLKPKDVILNWNGKVVADSKELTELVGDSKVGDKVKLSINRDGKTMDVALEVGARKEMQYSQKDNAGTERALRQYMQAFGTTGIGVSMQSLSGKLGDYFGVPDGEGALITEVMKDTPAEKAGLKTGDVIVKVDGDKVGSPSDVSTAIHEKKKGDKVDLVVMRDKAEKSVSLEVDEIEGLGSLDEFNAQMPNFHGNMRTPKMFRFDTNDNSMQQKMDELQSKLDEMQRKLDKLESKMK